LTTFDPATLRLVVVSDGAGDADRIARVARAAVAGGARTIVIREQALLDRALLELTRRLVADLRPRGALVFVSDRLDVAIAAGADGAQLGFRSLDVAEAREVAPKPFLLGVSAHAGDDLAALAAAGADHAFVGPVFDTPSKRSWKAPIGVDALRRAVASSPMPVVAIGGIEEVNAASARAAGVAGIAVIRAVFAASDPEAAARRLLAT